MEVEFAVKVESQIPLDGLWCEKGPPTNVRSRRGFVGVGIE